MNKEKTNDEARERTEEIAREFYAQGDATGWFDALYREAEGNIEKIPWADLEPNPNFVAWLEKHKLVGAGKKAVVIGCGLGDDAEEMAQHNFEVTAFDISPKAIEWARRIHPETQVNYLVADLFDLPNELKGNFDFVLEVYTVQALPIDLRNKAIKAIAELVAPNGELLYVGRGADEGETTENPPFPIRKSELEKFVEAGLTEIEFEDFHDQKEPPTRRFRAFYQRMR
jgi:SAM-dependent methyltransferase